MRTITTSEFKSKVAQRIQEGKLIGLMDDLTECKERFDRETGRRYPCEPLRFYRYLKKAKRMVFDPVGACLDRSELDWLYKHAAIPYSDFEYYFKVLKAPFKFESDRFVQMITQYHQIVYQTRLKPISWNHRDYPHWIVPADPKEAIRLFSDLIVKWSKEV